MPEPVVPRIVAVSDRFRAELLARERAAATRLVKAYGGAWARLVPALDALTQQIEAAQTAGQEVSPDWLRRQGRYRALLDQLAGEMGRFAAFADLTVQGEQGAAVEAALEHARELVGQALPPGLDFRALAELGIVWGRLPTEAVTDLVGTLGNGSPLRELLDALPGQVGGRVGQALVDGVSLGWGPRRTARVVRDEAGMGLSRALLVARTESLRAYRTASRRQYEANRRIVPKWRRHAAHDSRVCLACLILDGKEYASQEDMDDHPAGRCGMIPQTISYADLGLPVQSPPIEWERGQAWFERQPASVQEPMMGPRMFAAWRAGKFKLEQLPKLHKDETWGNSWTVASLKDLGIDWHDLDIGQAA